MTPMGLVYNSIPPIMKRIREILRNEYIGAIAIGFLLFQVFATVINTIMQPIVTCVENRGRPQSIFASHPIFNWQQIMISGISIVLNLLVALLLLYWLYRAKQPQPGASSEDRPAIAETSAATGKPGQPS